ncbi:MAG: SulP family inorganic anion transporter [Betaproteobacteria bacterium]|nr:SulP family inorganic anion transporter [Betaproteobacteria bacterium]
MATIRSAAASRWVSPDWSQFLPFLRWRARVDARTLRHDLLAGLTGAVVVLPQGVAFATIAGMPPEYGLYAGMVPAIVAALFGSSWHLVSGPTTAASVVLYSVLSPHAVPGSPEYVGLALALTFLVGALQLAMGLARLGSLINFISHSVVIGFTAGAALLIAVSQARHFFGMPIAQGAGVAATLQAVGGGLDGASPYVLAVSVTTLLTGLAVRRWLPRVPYMLPALAAGSLLGAWLNAARGQAVTGISTVAALPATLPPLSLPPLSLETANLLGTGVLAVALLALTEAVSIARALAVRTGQSLDGNQEFIGQGLSNLAGSFFSAYVATGSFNRSGVNLDAGARTPLAAVFAGVLLMAVVILVAPLAAWLPNAAMAGVLFLVAWSLIDFHHIRQILRTSRAESGILIATFLSALFVNLEGAIVLGVTLSLVMYLRRTSRPRIVSRVPDPATAQGKFMTVQAHTVECPQLRLARVDGSLYYGAINHIETGLAHADARKHLAIVAHGINFVDIDAAEFLANEAQRRRALGGGLYFVGLKPQVRAFLARGGYLERIGEDALFDSKTRAIETIHARLDRSVCSGCPHTVFRECADIPRGELPPRDPPGKEPAGKRYRRILVPYAPGWRGEALLARAAELAGAGQAALMVVQVLEERRGFDSDGPAGTLPAERLARRQPQARRELELLLARSSLGWAQARVLHGEAAAALAEVMRTWRPDLVVTCPSLLPAGRIEAMSPEGGATVPDVLSVGCMNIVARARRVLFSHVGGSA